ncbi:MAG TPA: iron-sulfur cluster assembly scaffold protein [Burkholderiaceae bacterium]|nr:iron-sulfur cluster assembly scaffold protein [Burkholderiaceae bacterium]
MAYSAIIADHFEHPRNVGTLDANDPRVGTGLAGSPAQGDVIRLQIRVDGSGIIEEARFKTYGSGAAIATSSLATEWLRGKTLAQAVAIDNMAIARELQLEPIKLHCAMLAEDAIAAAVRNYQEKHQG